MDVQKLLKIKELIHLKRFQLAKQYCLEYLTDYPNDTQAFYFMAVIHVVEGQTDAAKQIALDLVQKEATNKTFQTLLAEIFLAEKSYLQAESILLQGLAEEPDAIHLLVLLAKANLGLLRFEQAKLLFQLVLGLDPSNQEAINGLLLLGGMGHVTEETDLAIDPNNPYAVSQKIQHLLNSGKRALAYDMAMNSIKLFPEDDMIKDAVEDAIVNQRDFFYRIHQVGTFFGDVLLKSGKSFYWLFVSSFSLIVLWIMLGIKLDIPEFITFNVIYSFLTLLAIVDIKNTWSQIYLYYHPTGRFLLDERRNYAVFASQILTATAVAMFFIGFWENILMFCQIGYFLLGINIGIYYTAKAKENEVRIHLYILAGMVVFSLACIHYEWHRLLIICLASLAFFRGIHVSFFVFKIMDDKYTELAKAHKKNYQKPVFKINQTIHTDFEHPATIVVDETAIYWSHRKYNKVEPFKRKVDQNYYLPYLRKYSFKRINKICYRKGRVLLKYNSKVFRFPFYKSISFLADDKGAALFALLEKVNGVERIEERMDLQRPFTHAFVCCLIGWFLLSDVLELAMYWSSLLSFLVVGWTI